MPPHAARIAKQIYPETYVAGIGQQAFAALNAMPRSIRFRSSTATRRCSTIDVRLA